MKIKYLKIEGYKNLSKTILVNESDLISIIGSNGSGKSNLLEALSIIFRSLYIKDGNCSFNFTLEYITYSNIKVRIVRNRSKLSFFVNDNVAVSISDYLPKKVITIYSGEDLRLWDICYKPFYIEYINSINKQQSHAILPQMLYLNKSYWDISLLCLCLSTDENNKNFIKNVINIQEIEKIGFSFSKLNYSSYNNSRVLEFIKIIDSKQEYTLPELVELLGADYDINDIFSYFYMALTLDKPKILEDITIMFDDGIMTNDLSEGQKKLLLIKAAFEFAGQEDTLYILDEPDAHVHVNNKDKITKAFEPYKGNRQIVITTHSPTITKCLKEENLFMMNLGEFIPRTQQEIINDITGDFWNAHQQNSFLSNKNDLILLVEGKHDKTHIENAYNSLKTDYPDLNFGIFQLGGESKIRPFMTGLYEVGTFVNKKYIAIYDNDKAGMKPYNSDFENQNNNEYRKLKQNIASHDNFYAIVLPKPTDVTSECTIENMFDSNKYYQAYTQALLEYTPYFANKSIDDINSEIKDKSKNILADQSKSFDKEDFKNFRQLFDLILKIKNNSIKEQSITITDSPNIQVDSNNDKIVFKLNHAETKAQATYDFETSKMTILKNSQIKRTEIQSFATANRKYKEERDHLLASIDKTAENNYYILNEDVEVKSVRSAILFCTTTNLNSFTSWIDDSGKTLKDYIQQNDIVKNKG